MTLWLSVHSGRCVCSSRGFRRDALPPTSQRNALVDTDTFFPVEGIEGCRFQPGARRRDSRRWRWTNMIASPFVWVYLVGLIQLSVREGKSQHIERQSVVYGPCPPGRVCYGRQGDIVLGGLFPVHEFNPAERRCTGSIQLESMQWVEAMHHAIELVNNDSQILPGVRLGYEARDTCFDESMAVQQSLHFLPNFNAQECPLESRQGINTDNSNSSATMVGVSNDAGPPLVGVVGPYSSSNSMAANKLLGLFHTPMVSYGATNIDLSNKVVFPYFFRVLPSDRYASIAVAHLVRHFRWQFVSIVYTDDAFGKGGAEAIESELGKLTKGPKVCVALKEKIHLHTKNRTVYDKLLTQLVDNTSESSKASVVILYLQPLNARIFLEQASNHSRVVQRNFTFVGVDSWGDILSVVQSGVEAAKGSVSAIPFSKYLDGFDRHLETVRPSANNRWLCEVWEQFFLATCSCTAQSAHCANVNANRISMETKKYRQSSKVAFVYDAVLAFAHALNNIKKVFCPKASEKVCTQMTDGKLLNAFLKNVSFKGFNSEDKLFRFDASGDPFSARYSIKNMQVFQNVNTTGSPGLLNETSFIDFPTVGVFTAKPTDIKHGDSCVDVAERRRRCYALNLTWTREAFVWNDGSGKVPKSSCSDFCPPGHYSQVGSMACCWTCIRCGRFHYTPSQHNPCKRCPPNSAPVANRTACQILKPTQWDVKSQPMALTLTIIGAILALASLRAIFHVTINWHLHFPMMNAPTLISLLGVLFSYESVLFLAGGVTTLVCTAYEIFLSIGLTFCVSPFVVHAIFRYCEVCGKAKIVSFLKSSAHSAAMVLSLSLVPVIALIVSYSVSLPVTSKVLVANRSMYVRCHHGRALIATICYNVILAMFTAPLNIITARLGKSNGMSERLYRVLNSSGMCCLAMIVMAGCCATIFLTTDNSLVRTSTVYLGTVMCVSIVLFTLIINHLRKPPKVPLKSTFSVTISPPSVDNASNFVQANTNANSENIDFLKPMSRSPSPYRSFSSCSRDNVSTSERQSIHITDIHV